MKTTGLLVSMLSGILILALPPTVQAVPITVSINGVVCGSCTGNDTVIISDGTYGGVTIQGLSGPNTARVFAGLSPGSPDDSNTDRLTFRNAKITGAQVNTTYTITFWGEFAPLPTTSPSFWYKMTGQNNRFQTPAGQAAVNSWVQAKGFIEHAAGSGNWFQITSNALVQTITNLNFTKVFTPAHTLSQEFATVNQNRTLKGELKFKFANLSHELRGCVRLS